MLFYFQFTFKRDGCQARIHVNHLNQVILAVGTYCSCFCADKTGYFKQKHDFSPDLNQLVFVPKHKQILKGRHLYSQNNIEE